MKAPFSHLWVGGLEVTLRVVVAVRQVECAAQLEGRFDEGLVHGAQLLVGGVGPVRCRVRVRARCEGEGEGEGEGGG